MRPYDAIAITGSMPELDENLKIQLKVGGACSPSSARTR